MSLMDYIKKRNFQKTPEPSAGEVRKKKSKKLSFVIQKHAASHLHYDFRLEMDGVLKSWAVPKGPSLDPQQKRLAMHVEDHPLSYASFEGIIPQGEYGGGAVMVWDTGTWEPLTDPHKAYNAGKLEFHLYGKKLSGKWHLLRVKGESQGKNAWLLFKSPDEYSRSSKEYDVLEEESLSVKTNRTLEEIGGKKKSTKRKNSAPLNVDEKLARIKPQLATLVTTAPEGEKWLHEVKYDGYRLLAYINTDSVDLITRNDQNYSNKMRKIALSLENTVEPGTVLDGELVAIDENNEMNFQLLSNFLSLGESVYLVYFVFDILFYKGKDLRNMPLLERKKILKKALNKKMDNVRLSDYIIDGGPDIFESSCESKLEGIISKKVDSLYESKRTKTWLKIKCKKEKVFSIIGYLKSTKKGRGISSLLLGYYDKDKNLLYAGHVGTGFTHKMLDNLLEKFSKLKKKLPPFKNIPREIDRKLTVWVKPTLYARIKFTEWTNEMRLRHPVYLGLLSELEPPIVSDKKEKMSTDGNKITNQDKMIYPEKNISKKDLADYYEKIAPRMLPYIINRPLMILRCPQGQSQKCFFQKHYHENVPEGVYVVEIKEKEKVEPYIYIKDIKGLAALAQLAVIEIHPWGSTIKNIEKPDRIIFDLDPDPQIKWDKVIVAAQRLRACLLKYSLQSFVKTSGKKGLHLVVPVLPQYEWDFVKEFSAQIVAKMVSDYPQEYVGTMKKSERTGKIFIDYFRNGRGSTTVAPYSCRANNLASVSLPFSWKELGKIKSADSFDIESVLTKLKRSKTDPWKDFFLLKQKLL